MSFEMALLAAFATLIGIPAAIHALTISIHAPRTGSGRFTLPWRSSRLPSPPA